MPYASDAQRRFMHARHPEIAKRWDAHTPDMKSLPEHVGDKKKRKKKASADLFSLDKQLIKQAKIATDPVYVDKKFTKAQTKAAKTAEKLAKATTHEKAAKLAEKLGKRRDKLAYWQEKRAELAEKTGADLSPGSSAREDVPKKEFAMPGKSPEGHSEEKGKYPMPDKAHARAAIGFCAMHHGAGSSECQTVKSKAQTKLGSAAKLANDMMSSMSPSPMPAPAMGGMAGGMTPGTVGGMGPREPGNLHPAATGESPAQKLMTMIQARKHDPLKAKVACQFGSFLGKQACPAPISASKE